MTIKCVLFDLDGVLVDTKKIHFDALNEALVKYGYLPINYRDHLEKFDGLTTDDKLDICLLYTSPSPRDS